MSLQQGSWVCIADLNICAGIESGFMQTHQKVVQQPFKLTSTNAFYLVLTCLVSLDKVSQTVRP